jgi:hypothetical protein
MVGRPYAVRYTEMWNVTSSSLAQPCTASTPGPSSFSWASVSYCGSSRTEGPEGSETSTAGAHRGGVVTVCRPGMAIGERPRVNCTCAKEIVSGAIMSIMRHVCNLSCNASFCSTDDRARRLTFDGAGSPEREVTLGTAHTCLQSS